MVKQRFKSRSAGLRLHLREWDRLCEMLKTTVSCYACLCITHVDLAFLTSIEFPPYCQSFPFTGWKAAL